MLVNHLEVLIAILMIKPASLTAGNRLARGYGGGAAAAAIASRGGVVLGCLK